MVLYHGSNVVVDAPKILVPNRYLDFGNGFYTTANYDQAKNFAEKVTARRKKGKCCINIYELDDASMRDLNVLRFDGPNEDWLDFVYANRTGTYTGKSYDLICGPVANDDVYRTFILYETGVLTKDDTIAALKIKKLYDQYVFANDISLSCLKFIRTECGKDE